MMTAKQMAHALWMSVVQVLMAVYMAALLMWMLVMDSYINNQVEAFEPPPPDPPAFMVMEDERHDRLDL